jgi:precorrin-2/cobalt-factor-2 C20-methyltransferase
MEDLKPVYIVSLGPGEAGLISLIGGATLCRANAIFCPKTNARSRSSVLLKELKIKKESIRRYTLPMSKKREMAYEAYDKVFEEIVSLYSEGLCVAIVAEGDAVFILLPVIWSESSRKWGYLSSRLPVFRRLLQRRLPSVFPLWNRKNG